MSASPYLDPAHPKYDLVDVPRELRRRVLDLCTKRLWQDARDLLSQHGFTDCTFDDLQSFYDWAPTELPQHDRNADSLSAASVEPLSSVEPNRAATVRERSADCPEPARSHQLTTADPALTGHGASLSSPLITDDRSLTASSPSTLDGPAFSIEHPRSSPEHPASTPHLPPSPSVATTRCATRRARRRRSKITRLPKEIRDELNCRLENGATYTSVIEWLASKGHSGFNETNMSWWKNGGYQEWLRDEQRKQESRALRDWSAAIADKNDPTVLANALSNFSAAKLHRLLCELDYQAMARELQARPEVCIRYFNSAIRTGRVSLEAARVDHLVHTKNDKRAPTMAEIEDVERRLNLL